MNTADKRRIHERKCRMSLDERERHAEAIVEGYKDEVCSKCKAVYLACHFFVRCDESRCPMIARDEGGKRKPSLLQLIS